jgi:uncharacterized protein
MSRSHYIYINRIVRPGMATNPTPDEQRIMAEHFEYLKARLSEGQLVLAGPCLDAAFGVVIFYAEDDEDARQFMEADPAIAHGLMTADLRPFKISLHRAPDA